MTPTQLLDAVEEDIFNDLKNANSEISKTAATAVNDDPQNSGVKLYKTDQRPTSAGQQSSNGQHGSYTPTREWSQESLVRLSKYWTELFARHAANWRAATSNGATFGSQFDIYRPWSHQFFPLVASNKSFRQRQLDLHFWKYWSALTKSQYYVLV